LFSAQLREIKKHSRNIAARARKTLDISHRKGIALQIKRNDGNAGRCVPGSGSRLWSRRENGLHIEPNQIARKRQDVHVSASDLLVVPQGSITEAGLRQNLNVGIGYIEAWLRGTGCVPLYNLMEDAATAEISRAQIWQWIRHSAKLKDGRVVDVALCRALLDEELGKLRAVPDHGTRYEDAASLFCQLIEAEVFPEFLTLPAYDMITAGIG